MVLKLVLVAKVLQQIPENLIKKNSRQLFYNKTKMENRFVQLVNVYSAF